MLSHFFQFKQKRGFTLLETIIAAFILVVGIGGAFSSISQTIAAASLVKDKFIASYLAQEGIEIVKNIRDGNWLEGANWNDGLAPGDWEADYTSQTLSIYTPPGRPLRIDNTTGFYNYTSGTPTKFRRRIQIESLDPDRIKVTVEIAWQERGRTQRFRVVSQITNWYF